MNKTLLAGISGLLFYTSAQTALAADKEPITIVITASRSAETVDETMAPVSVIDRKQIETSGAANVPELLASVPGLVISRNGGVGQQTSIFLRGAESDQILVLIDGVKVGSATLGTTPFQDISLDQVEKIEVVRGPRSSLYGSEAIGGVIQIFTRKGSQGTRPTLRVSAGSHGTTDLHAGISGGSNAGWYSLNVSKYHTDGFNACKGSFSSGCFTVEPDADGYDNTSVALRGGTKLSDNFGIEGGILNSQSETQFDGSFQNESESLTRVVHVKANFNVSDHWASSLLIAQSKDASDSFLNGTFSSKFETTRDQISLQNDLMLSSGRLIFGADHISDDVNSNTAFTVTSRDNMGIFASYNMDLGDNEIELSVRNDDNEQFGSETTGGIAYGRDMGDGNRMTLSYGTAFKAPTFNELYYPGFGNADLQAETSSSIDLGFSGRTDSGRWSLNLFRTEIEDLIGFDSVTFAPVNINKAEIMGIELASSMNVAGWVLGTSLTLQDPKDASGSFNDGKQLARRAKRIVQLTADRKIGEFNVGATMTSRGKAYDNLSNTTELGSYALLDLRAEYKVHSKWSLGLQVNNVFDKEYETAASYNQDGVNAMVTLRYIP
ncbi:MAG: TonB-dependent receptor [Gammaproteobacteria bacterium]|nr:TonB-dependent receptor [Gammaproteobacteria bacterium]